MTDEELLELAAKAAGWTWWQSKHGYWNVTSPEGKTESCCVGWDASTIDDAFMEIGWNPLTDDGDALRLAVKLDMNIVFDFDRVMIVYGDGDGTCVTEYFYELPEPTDRYAATRRAIVRAAAQCANQK